MKLLASAVVLCCAATAGAAAPASAAASAPRAFDFELAPGGRPALAAGSKLVSRQLRAPRRFNLVGLRWRGRSEPRVALRVRSSGGRWSRWAALDAHAEHAPDPGRGERGRGGTAPLWVGGADWVQYRLSRRVPGLRLHFVNVDSATRARAAQAAEPQPAIVPREDWGASSCPPRSAPSYGSVKAAHIHHTVSLNDYSQEEAPSIVLAICRFHRNSNGWNDIGYNFLVDKFGTLYEGRAGGIDEPVLGAQAQGFNAQTTGIANIGDHSSVPQSPEAIAAMSGLIRWKLPLHGVPTSGTVILTSAGGSTNRYPAGAQVEVPRVLGHRDTNSTACPGAALYAQLPELRSLVEGAGPALGARTTLTALLAARSVLYKGAVLLGGALSSFVTGPLSGEVVYVQAFRGGRWVTAQRVRTGQSGAFQTVLRPRASRRIRVRYPGRADNLPSSSPSALLRVRPLVSLSRPPRRGVRGVRVRIRGAVVPSKGRLYLVLQLRRRGGYRKLGVRTVAVKSGRFTTSFVPSGTGLYRFYLVAKADGATDRARSALRLVRVGRFAGGVPARR